MKEVIKKLNEVLKDPDYRQSFIANAFVPTLLS